jgi:hypothetical protein
MYDNNQRGGTMKKTVIKKEEKEIRVKKGNTSGRRKAARESLPLSMLERVRQRPTLSDPEWFNARREARPTPMGMKPAGGVLVPKHLLKGANRLVHKSFVPQEAELFPTPRLVGRTPTRPLRRFSGQKVTPANQTFFEGNEDGS